MESPSPRFPPCGTGRGENIFFGAVTQGGARSSLALGYYQAIPAGFQFGSLRSPEARHELQRLTVTRKKVAGIEVLPSVLLFCAFASSKSWLWRSSTLPLF